ncbi:MAG: peptidoglycan DD-metalloendopeptidase family protein [Buchnera aphidicola (Nurudea yanoniella)]
MNCNTKHNNIIKSKNKYENTVKKNKKDVYKNIIHKKSIKKFFLKEHYFPCSQKNNTSFIFLNNFFSLNKILKPLYSTNIFKKRNINFYKLSKNNIHYLISKNIFMHGTQKYCEYISIKGQLNTDFIKKSKNSGLDINEIKNIISIIKYQIHYHQLNFYNQFSILIKKNIFDEKIYKNKIIGLKIYNSSINYYGILAKNGKFYDQKGYSLMGVFLKFPVLKKYRISSNFNPNRLNPITKKISPHQGVDIAVPIGTPILSIGNGEIIKTKSSIAAGKYITIKHNVQYTSRYMHLKKILVKVGDIVKKGEKIGLSGNTGYSTGPHLHYEIWEKNKVVNPEKLIILEKLSEKDLKTYLQLSKKIFTFLKKL